MRGSHTDREYIVWQALPQIAQLRLQAQQNQFPLLAGALLVLVHGVGSMHADDTQPCKHGEGPVVVGLGMLLKDITASRGPGPGVGDEALDGSPRNKES